jgi:ISXO2-like transposase domain/Transposase zinc-ribbon domain
MKRNSLSVIEVAQQFATEEKCLNYLEKMRWPEGVRCVSCGHDKVSKFTTEASKRSRKYISKVTGVAKDHVIPARTLYQCLNPKCREQFSAKSGTIFEDSHLPINKWFQAIALMVNAKKGLSALQMHRDLRISYRTAWYLNHRIRKAMEEGNPGLLAGVIEADETYLGGAYDRRRHRGPNEKQAVFGVIQRGEEGRTSKVRAFPIPTNSSQVITGAVRGNVSPKAELFITDESRAYKQVGKEYNHETVKHINLEYVRKGDPRIHTNSIEGFWSLFQRGLIGSFHKVSVKHLRRYLDEFSFRFNNRDAEDLFGLVVLNLVIGTVLRYAELTADPQEPSAEPQEPRSSYEPW